uniref:ATP-dependent Clp protease proteolytic subunit n=1 Tax=Passiflora foetida TaxID=159421 RepID=A0A4Y5QIZ3_PASFO|nr:clp protease proteolytic subunit [Passiflora foetida]QCX30761.1 clp protease proteolytic subunit [Passiflora foetida]
MPLGVPKVPFDLPEEEEETWIDLYNALYKQKQLFLFQEVNSEMANQLIHLFLHLNTENFPADFCLYINSPGGWILPGMSLYNTMSTMYSDIRTICVGMAASMASFILAAGDRNKRLAFPHARVMIHQPHGHFSEEDDDDDDDDDNDDDDDDDDNNDDIEFFREMQELITIQEDIAKIYAKKTGQPLEVILEDLQSDSFMSATEAQAHGIVDCVGKW